MHSTTISSPDDEDPRGQVERRKEPFVPDRNRVVYPVDHATSRQAALAKFQAEIRIVVGAQLTKRAVEEACDVEDTIRSRVHDEAQYAALQMLSMSYIGAAIRVRDEYMGVDDRSEWRPR